MAARLGRYDVLKHLASGGMADVLLGRTEGLEGFERHVVLKRIKPEHAQDLRFIRMLLDEARVAANLHHQHIVQVHDIGESDGDYFIAMEYLHGEDVRTILLTASRSRQHVPLGYAMAIVSAAAAGLHYAHERRGPDKQPLGIVHRDISPSNILVGYDGSIKVVDFGLAKASARQESRTGSLKGKVSYMSPEQCRSAEIDRRSDVYSLGVVLYELATTTRLFKGTNDYLVMDQIVNGRVPPPRSRRPDLPNELSAVIMRAIAPDPERRFATADELRRAIDQVAEKLGLTASSSAIAAYMRQQFGEKPEPWLDLGGQVMAPLDGVVSAGSRPDVGWTELWRNDSAPLGSGSPAGSGAPRGSGPVLQVSGATGTGVGDAAPPAAPEPRDATRGEGNRLAFPGEPPAAGAGRAPVSLDETSLLRRPALRPSTAPTDSRMGWESRLPARTVSATRSAKIAAAIGTPVIVSIGVAIWWFAGSDALPTRTVEVKPVEAIPPIEEVTKLATVPAAEPEDEEVPARPPAPPAVAQAHSPGISTGAGAAAGPAQGPAVVDAPLVVLSHALVERVAAAHARELSACDDGDDLRGEVAVRFSVDSTGKVSNAQVTTTPRKPRVATCILRSVQKWQFPRQGDAGAQGTYTLSFP